jgi:hypothetical protein
MKHEIISNDRDTVTPHHEGHEEHEEGIQLDCGYRINLLVEDVTLCCA